uniref:Uncharacterized protein n=1 Tax=Romanomermis culicivorax TaxID=13658 RepID=A0A915KP72_ROMCU
MLLRDTNPPGLVAMSTTCLRDEKPYEDWPEGIRSVYKIEAGTQHTDPILATIQVTRFDGTTVVFDIIKMRCIATPLAHSISGTLLTVGFRAQEDAHAISRFKKDVATCQTTADWKRIWTALRHNWKYSIIWLICCEKSAKVVHSSLYNVKAFSNKQKQIADDLDEEW